MFVGCEQLDSKRNVDISSFYWYFVIGFLIIEVNHSLFSSTMQNIPSILSESIDSFVNVVFTSDRHEGAYQSIKSHMTPSKPIHENLSSTLFTFPDLLESLDKYLTSTDDKERSRATLLVATLLGDQQVYSHRLINSSILHLLVIFFCRRLADYPSILPSLQALTNILQYHHVNLDPKYLDKLEIFTAIFKEIYVQSYAQNIRYKVLELFETILMSIESEPSSFRLGTTVEVTAVELLDGIITSVEGEKDPRCLIIGLRVLKRSVLCFVPSSDKLLISFQPAITRAVNATICYFPITFIPPEDDSIGITQESILVSFQDFFTCHRLISRQVMNFLLARLQDEPRIFSESGLDDSSIVTAAEQSLELFTRFFDQYAEILLDDEDAMTASTQPAEQSSALSRLFRALERLIGLSPHAEVTIEASKLHPLLSSLVKQQQQLSSVPVVGWLENLFERYGVSQAISMESLIRQERCYELIGLIIETLAKVDDMSSSYSTSLVLQPLSTILLTLHRRVFSQLPQLLAVDSPVAEAAVASASSCDCSGTDHHHDHRHHSHEHGESSREMLIMDMKMLTKLFSLLTTTASNASAMDLSEQVTELAQAIDHHFITAMSTTTAAQQELWKAMLQYLGKAIVYLLSSSSSASAIACQSIIEHLLIKLFPSCSSKEADNLILDVLIDIIQASSLAESLVFDCFIQLYLSSSSALVAVNHPHRYVVLAKFCRQGSIALMDKAIAYLICPPHALEQYKCLTAIFSSSTDEVEYRYRDSKSELVQATLVDLIKAVFNDMEEVDRGIQRQKISLLGKLLRSIVLTAPFVLEVIQLLASYLNSPTSYDAIYLAISALHPQPKSCAIFTDSTSSMILSNYLTICYELADNLDPNQELELEVDYQDLPGKFLGMIQSKFIEQDPRYDQIFTFSFISGGMMVSRSKQVYIARAMIQRRDSRHHKYHSKILDRLYSYLQADDVDARDFASRYAPILVQTDPSANSSLIYYSPVWKQQFWMNWYSRLLTAAKLSNQACLIALWSIASQLPVNIILSNSSGMDSLIDPEFYRLLLESLSSSYRALLTQQNDISPHLAVLGHQSLLTMEHLLCHDASIILAELATILPIFLKVAQYDNQAMNRQLALKCVSYLVSLPYPALYPLRKEVIRALGRVIDDKKRAIRMFAAKIRNQWITMEK
jgi:hypothetical protein